MTELKTIKGDLIMEKDMTFEENLRVEGNIFGRDEQKYNLTVKGNLNCRNLNCRDLKCKNLICWDLNCEDLNCRNLNCGELNFHAVAISYKSFKCSSWKARRDNFVIKCLDNKIEIK